MKYLILVFLAIFMLGCGPDLSQYEAGTDSPNSSVQYDAPVEDESKFNLKVIEILDFDMVQRFGAYALDSEAKDHNKTILHRDRIWQFSFKPDHLKLEHLDTKIKGFSSITHYEYISEWKRKFKSEDTFIYSIKVKQTNASDLQADIGEHLLQILVKGKRVVIIHLFNTQFIKTNTNNEKEN